MRYVWRFLDTPLVWQFRGDGPGTWIDCDADTQKAIREAEARGGSALRLRLRNWEYAYDLEARRQQNLSSGKERQLRRRNPWDPATAPEAGRGPARDVPRWQFATGFGWSDCDEETQGLLRMAEAVGQRVVQVDLRGFPYEFDLEGLTQTNRVTGRVRELQRRGLPAASAAEQPVEEARGAPGVVEEAQEPEARRGEDLA